jgi:hypothetical protein
MKCQASTASPQSEHRSVDCDHAFLVTGDNIKLLSNFLMAVKSMIGENTTFIDDSG